MHKNLFEKILRKNFKKKLFLRKNNFFIKEKTDIKQILRRKSPIKKSSQKNIQQKKLEEKNLFKKIFANEIHKK